MGCGTSTLDICRAADRGDAWAQYRLGEIYANGTGGMDKDEVRAVRMYRLAAEQGNDWAQFRLGEFYANGTGGLAKDEVEAVRLYSLAAEQGNDWAQNRLGDHYADGTCGLAMDEVKAVRLFRLAAQQGDRWAQGRLGHFYDEGRGGLVKDEFEAVRLFLLAGEHGVPMLGVHYANGTGGLVKDEVEAVRLFRLAVEQGSMSAPFLLGVHYANGTGGLTKDTGEAAGLFRLAVRRFVTGAGNGNVFAQFKLGEHYANGTCGLAKDKGEAVRLFRLAAEHGHPEAQNKIAALGKHTTQEKGHLTNAHPHTTRAAAVTTATTTALAAPALVDGKQFHCFLTHDWGKDVDSRGRDNHTRVGLVNAGLQARGLKTWFDSDKMEGNVVDRMCSGIEDSAIVVVFVTKRYILKVAGKGENGDDDNCKLEFQYAMTHKKVHGLVSVPMEKQTMSPAQWTGPVGIALSQHLYQAQFATTDTDAAFEEQIDKLYAQIVHKCENLRDTAAEH